jgi:hypothetical protein
MDRVIYRTEGQRFRNAVQIEMIRRNALLCDYRFKRFSYRVRVSQRMWDLYCYRYPEGARLQALHENVPSTKGIGY